MGRRAVGDEEKRRRRTAILRVARAVLERRAFDAFTMAEVARKAGLAKGTIYLYFATKEEMFLALLEGLLLAWFDDVDARLERLGGRPTVERVARVVAASVGDHEMLARLLTILHTSLEHNVARASALRFKQLVLARLLRTGRRLEGDLPFLGPGQGALLLMRVDALVIGLRHLSDPAPVVRQVLEEPGMEVFKVDFGRELAASLLALFKGLEAGARKGRRWARA